MRLSLKRYRFLLTAFFAPLAVILISCCGDGNHSSGGSSTDATCSSPIPHVSISAVNGWPGLDPEAYAKELADNCAGLVEIEALPWFDRSGKCDSGHPSLCMNSYKEQRRELLKAMSAHKITTFIQPINFNAYGPSHMTSNQYREHIKGIVKDASEVGLQWVWLGAGGEPWAVDEDQAYEWTKIARDEWQGVFVIADRARNHPSGEPYFTTIPHDWVEVHPCDFDDAAASVKFSIPVFTVTDCSPVLNPGPAASQFLAMEAVNRGVPLVIYDHFATEIPDNAPLWIEPSHGQGGEG